MTEDDTPTDTLPEFIKASLVAAAMSPQPRSPAERQALLDAIRAFEPALRGLRAAFTQGGLTIEDEGVAHAMAALSLISISVAYLVHDRRHPESIMRAVRGGITSAEAIFETGSAPPPGTPAN